MPLALLIATSARAQFVEEEVFVTPSMKIECTFRPAGPELSCDRFGPRHLRLVLGPSGVAQMFSVAADDECCGADNVLDFGMTWSRAVYVPLGAKWLDLQPGGARVQHRQKGRDGVLKCPRSSRGGEISPYT